MTAYFVLDNFFEQHGDVCGQEWIVRASSTEDTAELPSAPLSASQLTWVPRYRKRSVTTTLRYDIFRTATDDQE